MKPFSRIASFLLALVALMHLLRILTHTQIIIGTCEIPMWVSVFGLIIPGVLSIAVWMEAK